MKKGKKKSTALKKVKPLKEKKEIAKITDTHSLIEFAIKNEAGIEQLKEILKMKHDEEARQAEKLFHINFCKMQAEFPVIPKKCTVNTKAETKMYSYANMPTIVPIVGPIIARHGFAYRWTKEFPEPDKIKIIFHFTGYGHTETCFMVLPIMQSNNFVNSIQQSGSTSTYGERYTFCGMLGIVSDEDDDGRGSKIDPPPAQPQSKPADKPPATAPPEVIPPDKKPLLPENIKSTDICTLGKFLDVPVKFNKVPLSHLIDFQKQAGNPEALNNVIHETIDKMVEDYMMKLEYKATDLKAMIKLDIKKDIEYPDLNQDQKIIVLRNLKGVVDKKAVQK